MKTIKLIPTVGVLCLGLFWGTSSHAQNTTRAAQSSSQSKAQSVLTRLLTLNNQKKLKTAAAKQLLAGEAMRFAEMEQLGTFSSIDTFKLIDSRHAVGRVQALNAKVPVADVYFYLILFGSEWKISALRSMAMTGMIEAAISKLKKKPTLTREESEELANMQLTLALDRELRAYFKGHYSQFQQLLPLATQKLAMAQAPARQLRLSAVESEKNGNLLFVIGGILDNTVGYVYSPSNRPPAITSDEYIWVEKITDKWYLFRTT